MSSGGTVNAAGPANLTASVIARSLKTVIDLGEAIAKDIPSEKFAHMPHPNMNHPAFCFGHLALYPNKVLAIIGRSDLVREKPGWDAVLSASAKCVEQADHYPAKADIMEFFSERHRTALHAVLETDTDTFGLENPATGRFKEMFPTVGDVVNFMMGAHAMFHLGQASAWRRAVGLPSVM